ncbi:MAG: tRNA modification GTPase, partial [Cryomorphaceae bacterium]
MYFKNQSDTICALSTASGMGAIALIRLSGKEAVEIVNQSFSKNISTVKGYSLHYGTIVQNGEQIDDVVAAVYRN